MKTRKTRPRAGRGAARLVSEPLEARYLLHGSPSVFPEVTLHTSMGDITMEMRADAAPGTAENFLNYVEDGDYTNAIFHRLVSEFVLQGGGFTSDPAELCDAATCTLDDIDPDQFSEVPTDDTIQNEFNLSNTMATIAMAKLGGNPDSATSQFFINLVDNFFLDSSNGGFTVFAQVTDMTNVETIAELTTGDLSTIFPSGSPLRALGELPIETKEIDGVDKFRVVRIESISGNGVLHGTYFLDRNGDGVFDEDEGGIPGVTVYVDANNNGSLDDGEDSALTDIEGAYHFPVETGEHVIRAETLDDYVQTGLTDTDRVVAQVRIGADVQNVDVGNQYVGTSWHNDLLGTDVNGVNGLSPLDAILVINELGDRIFSDGETGALPVLTEPPAEGPQFLDVDQDGFVGPVDAVSVINDLTASSMDEQPPQAALSSSVTAVSDELMTAAKPVDLDSRTSVVPASLLPAANEFADRPCQIISKPALSVDPMESHLRADEARLADRIFRRFEPGTPSRAVSAMHHKGETTTIHAESLHDALDGFFAGLS